MVKYDHDISNNHQLTTLLYIFITDITTPDIEKRFCNVILKKNNGPFEYYEEQIKKKNMNALKITLLRQLDLI